MSKKDTNINNARYETLGAVRERERERELYFTQQGKCVCKTIVIDNKRAGENSALKVMDKKENQKAKKLKVFLFCVQKLKIKYEGKNAK